MYVKTNKGCLLHWGSISLLACLVTWAQCVEAANFNLRVSLRELDTNRPIDAKINMDIEATGTTKEFSRRSTGEYEFKESLGLGGLDRYKINVAPQNSSHTRRIIVLRSNRFEENLTRKIKL